MGRSRPRMVRERAAKQASQIQIQGHFGVEAMRVIKHSKDDKARAAAIWALCGNQKETERQTGIYRKTIAYWINNKDPDFWDFVAKAREEFDKALSGKIIDTMDRLLNKVVGNIDALSPKEALWCYAVLFDKRQLIENKPTSISARTDFTKRLQDVSEQLAKHAGQAPEMPQPEGVIH